MSNGALIRGIGWAGGVLTVDWAEGGGRICVTGREGWGAVICGLGGEGGGTDLWTGREGGGQLICGLGAGEGGGTDL